MQKCNQLLCCRSVQAEEVELAQQQEEYPRWGTIQISDHLLYETLNKQITKHTDGCRR